MRYYMRRTSRGQQIVQCHLSNPLPASCLKQPWAWVTPSPFHRTECIRFTDWAYMFAEWDTSTTSSCSANRDKIFWSNLGRGYAGHTRMRSWDYGMIDTTENAKGYSWYTTLKTMKVGKTKLATKLSDSKLASTPTSLVLQLPLGVLMKAEHLHTTVAVEGLFKSRVRIH